MNRFNFLCALTMLFCMALVGVACAISKAVWYVWLLTLAANAAVMYFCIKNERTEKELSEHEQYLRCARISWNFTGSLGLTSVFLGVMDGVFGDIVILVISLSVIWLCLIHFADNNDKLLWWIGWFATMDFAIVLAALNLMIDLGLNIASIVLEVILALIILSCAITLILGFILYIYPKIKELSADIKEINDMIKMRKK